jgi:hypothetical protein
MFGPAIEYRGEASKVGRGERVDSDEANAAIRCCRDICDAVSPPFSTKTASAINWMVCAQRDDISLFLLLSLLTHSEECGPVAVPRMHIQTLVLSDIRMD